MNNSHLILILLWIIYYVLHSVFAATSVKKFFREKWNIYRFYRLTYSIIVSILLVLILFFQYSFTSPVLWNIPVMKLPAILVFILPGLVIMFISVKKYFFLLSGVSSLYEEKPASELKIEGIHRRVRHPLYTGTLLVVWGFFLIFPFLNNLIAVLLLTGYVLVGIQFEEKKLLLEFGEAYRKYMDQVPSLIPGLSLKKKRIDRVNTS